MQHINDIVKDKLEDLSLLEESHCDILDMAAEPFSAMMGRMAEEVMPYKNVTYIGLDFLWESGFM